MAIFCKTCIAACCNHCKHYESDPDDSPLDDEWCGTCRLHGFRADPLNDCGDFFCRAAEADGYGYPLEADHPSRGPGFKIFS